VGVLGPPPVPGRDPEPGARQPRAQSPLPAAAATQGLERELRASLVSNQACWGAVGLYRDRRQPDFDDSEARFLAGLSAPIADGFRRSLLLTARPPADLPDGPGLLVLDHRGDLESVTTAALRWIEELGDPGSGQSLPMVVRAVAAQARHAGDDHPHAPVSARSRAATRSGRWLVVHAMRMHGAETGRIAVIIEPADPREAAPLIVAATGWRTGNAPSPSWCCRAPPPARSPSGSTSPR
jgi:hypothetical protein